MYTKALHKLGNIATSSYFNDGITNNQLEQELHNSCVNELDKKHHLQDESNLNIMDIFKRLKLLHKIMRLAISEDAHKKELRNKFGVTIPSGKVSKFDYKKDLQQLPVFNNNKFDILPKKLEFSQILASLDKVVIRKENFYNYTLLKSIFTLITDIFCKIYQKIPDKTYKFKALNRMPNKNDFIEADVIMYGDKYYHLHTATNTTTEIKLENAPSLQLEHGTNLDSLLAQIAKVSQSQQNNRMSSEEYLIYLNNTAILDEHLTAMTEYLTTACQKDNFRVTSGICSSDRRFKNAISNYHSNCMRIIRLTTDKEPSLIDLIRWGSSIGMSHSNNTKPDWYYNLELITHLRDKIPPHELSETLEALLYNLHHNISAEKTLGRYLIFGEHFKQELNEYEDLRFHFYSMVVEKSDQIYSQFRRSGFI